MKPQHNTLNPDLGRVAAAQRPPQGRRQHGERGPLVVGHRRHHLVFLAHRGLVHERAIAFGYWRRRDRGDLAAFAVLDQFGRDGLQPEAHRIEVRAAELALPVQIHQRIAFDADQVAVHFGDEGTPAAGQQGVAGGVLGRVGTAHHRGTPRKLCELP